MADLEDISRELESMINGAIRSYGMADPRSKQSAAGIIGPSDLGFCRQKAALMTRGISQSDAKSIWPAQVGTAVHHYFAGAIRETFPTWIVDDKRVTTTFPSGFEVSGTPDLMGVMAFSTDEFYLVLDAKTKDGLNTVRRSGATLNNRYQRFTYAHGAVQAGYSKGMPVLLGNIYLDRSGATEGVFIDLEVYDASLAFEIDEWISDVTYAVKHNEDAMRDVAAPVCEIICEYFTVCRGQLPVSEQEPIRDPELVAAIDMYVEGKAMEKAARSMKSEASSILHGINGTDGRYQVRWTTVGETQVPGFSRSGYEKIDVRKARS